MPFGIKRLSIGGKADFDEKKDAIPQDNIDASQAPPTYSAMDPLPETTTEDLSAAFNELNIQTSPTNPTVDLCLAHLKLLNAFFNLKEEIGYTDGLFGLWDSRVVGIAGPAESSDEAASKSQEEALSKIREKRWALYVARAVDRFEVWWLKVLCTRETTSGSPANRLRQADLESPYMSDFPITGKPQVWTADMLPPIGKFFFKDIVCDVASACHGSSENILSTS